ncbi:MAG: Carboxyl-terminal protease [uncultured Gemmatimonadetes bacterium]|uniref:Carboxyl-terminal protease n=1 Tax=uncultured Gemmatimonadota bacterium TaxID=203437 RepID=A0A6J4L3Q5_9BACT|nr:MAG: Carboxyl-terminal protease [uncultured Gemmatimonadota bacterium]
MQLKRTVVAPALVAGMALVSGGWLLQQDVNGGGSVFARARLFDEVMTHVMERYVEPQSEAELYQKAVEGLLRELGDPHTSFMTAEEYAQLHLQTSGEYGGLGIQISSRDGWVTAVGILPETPAERAGVRVGDRFLEIDGQSAEGLSDDQAVQRLRGRKGTPVTVKVQRVGVEQPITFTIVREEIHVRSVPNAYMVAPGVGYANLVMFSATSTAELRAAIDRLRSEGARSLVLDLRSNPGGLLDQGVGVSDLFLKRNESVVEIRARDPRESETYSAADDQAYEGLTVAVLVDGYSASAAEIVAGALQDHDRALVLGSATYGKGSVQTLLPLSGGNALKITTAKWYTPVGRSIQREAARGEGEEEARVDDEAEVLGADGTPVTATDTTKKVPYRTDSGRTVFGGGGIVPDLIVRQDTAVEAEKEFFRVASRSAAKFQNALFGFAVAYERAHPELRPDFAVTPEMRRGFYERLRAAGVDVTWEVFQGAQRFIDARLIDEIARSKFGSSVAARRDDPTDRVLQEAIRLLQQAPDTQALLRAAQQRPAAAARSR